MFVCGIASPEIRRLPRVGKAYSEESEDFLRRALGLYTYKFQKCCIALLTDLPEHHLCPQEMCFCLPELHL